MLDFAGRSFLGWHHHMTMTSAAYAYSRLASAPGPAAGGPTPAAQTSGEQVSGGRTGGGRTTARAVPPQRSGARATQPTGATVRTGRQRGSRPAHAATAGAVA
ncbi:hypothetical protein ACFWSF_09295 [Streptomyces sp. NPDC058611]|uniref:hypothetical protein n=1 Tax=unclassified Streptomyces TaxID=2593676 RepID=UPI0036620BBB